MSSVLILSLIMIVVSGLIAYVGDLIGRRMGRKRLSLFGLRPKHTAIIISIVAGAIIAAVTLTATFIVNREVREALFTPLIQVKDELAASRIDLKKAHSATTAAENTMRTRSAELTQAEGKLATADAKLIKLNTQHEDAVAKLQIAQAELRKITTQLKRQEDEYNKAKLMLAKAESELGNKRKGLLTAQNILVDITRKKSALEDKRLALEQQVIELGDQISLLSKLASGTFTPPSIIAGQEILTGRFDSRKDNLHGDVAAFVAAAGDVVRRSSPQLPPGSEPVIYLDSKNDKAVRLTAEETTKILISKITALKPNPVIIHLISANNVPENGQAIVALNSQGMIYPDEVIYKNGDEIARMTIKKQDTTASALEIIVNDFLGKSVPTELQRQHLIAVNRRFTNRKIDIDNSGSFVSWDKLLSAAERAAAVKGDAVVIARSKGETTRYSPLDITIDIVPVNAAVKSP